MGQGNSRAETMEVEDATEEDTVYAKLRATRIDTIPDTFAILGAPNKFTEQQKRAADWLDQ